MPFGQFICDEARSAATPFHVSKQRSDAETGAIVLSDAISANLFATKQRSDATPFHVSKQRSDAETETNNRNKA
jgi:hypothetical protein